MSNQVTTTTLIKAPGDKVRAAILDLEGYPAWQREMKSVVVKERDEQGRPSVVVFDVAVAGQSAGYTLQYSYPSDDVISSTLTEGSLITKQDQTYTLTPVAEGTQLDYALDMAVKWDIPDFMLNAIIKKGVKTNTNGIKKNAEAS
jgi:ribosome-associated toxin RatA of RatAB toxin-antitoxin module